MKEALCALLLGIAMFWLLAQVVGSASHPWDPVLMQDPGAYDRPAPIDAPRDPGPSREDLQDRHIRDLERQINQRDCVLCP